MENFERALKATRLVLEENPAGNRDEATMNSFGSEDPGRALKCVLNVLKASSCSGDLLDLVRDLKNATNEIFVCQRNNKRAFKFAWYCHVANSLSSGRFSTHMIGNGEGRVSQALNSVAEIFASNPFAVSLERTRDEHDQHMFVTLNHNHEAATRHKTLARQIGKAWVDENVRKYIFRVQCPDFMQAWLFQLLWSDTVEQIRQHSPHSSDDPERPEFETAVEELERVLQEGMVRSKKQPASIAFCGTVKADKSLFLNALIGRLILPSDGESDYFYMPHPILSIIAEPRSNAWPCRIRHVLTQTNPTLQFRASAFLTALKKLQDHQYGRKMQTYRPPPENIFETLPSGAPYEPSDEEISLRTMHSRWVDVNPSTRGNLLMFETPGFELPQMAIGEEDVKNLVCFVSGWTVCFSTECCVQLG
jgi:hypothetical protein